MCLAPSTAVSAGTTTAPRGPQRPGDLTLAQPGLVRQPEHFSDVSHGGSGPRHRYLAHKIGQLYPSEAVAHLPTDPAAPHAPEQVLHYSGTAAAVPPERVIHFDRNGCSITSGVCNAAGRLPSSQALRDEDLKGEIAGCTPGITALRRSESLARAQPGGIDVARCSVERLMKGWAVDVRSCPSASDAMGRLVGNQRGDGRRGAIPRWNFRFSERVCSLCATSSAASSRQAPQSPCWSGW